jgi:type IV secretory pathway TraG/TraD family ATPase VirD4
LLTPAQIRQLDDEDIVVLHHNLPPFRAKRMNWREHTILRQRQAMRPPALHPLPMLTPIELRFLDTSADGHDDDPINLGDLE